jgi:MFS transporter, PAT family, beta-lactamase induction signal transducer AmpG
MTDHRIAYRQSIIFILGIASGLPLALSAGTLQTWFAVSGASKPFIASLSLLGLPYVLKFLWAPLLDWFSFGRCGRRRAWILFTQCLLVMTFLAMSWFSPVNVYVLLGLGFFCAFLSASQDIAIDAYRADLLPAAEGGLGAAMAAAGYRVGQFLSGAVALICADYWGWPQMYRVMAVLLLVLSLATLLSPALAATQRESRLGAAFTKPYQEFLARDHAWLLIAFVVWAKIGEAFTANAGGLINTFLLRECGLSLTELGLLNKMVGLVSLLLGLFCAGLMMLRLRLDRVLFGFLLLQAVSNLGYYILALGVVDFWVIGTVIALDNFTAGLTSAALVALLMRCCDPRYSATQYAVLSALAGLGRVLLVPLAAGGLAYLSWAHFFLLTFLLALPALWLLSQLRRKAPQWLIAS